MNVSPRYASLISQVPPLWHGLGMQGPTSTTLEQLGSVKPLGHSQEKESSSNPKRQMPPFSHGLGSQISPLLNWGTPKLSPTKSQAATKRFMIPSSGRDPGWSGVVAEGTVAEVVPQDSSRPRPCHRFLEDVFFPQSFHKFLERE